MAYYVTLHMVVLVENKEQSLNRALACFYVLELSNVTVFNGGALQSQLFSSLL